MGRHQSDFANNVGPEFDILAFQTYQINAQNSFGNDLSSQIDDRKLRILSLSGLSCGQRPGLVS